MAKTNPARAVDRRETHTLERTRPDATLPAFTATVAKNEFGRVLDAAIENGAVAITRHDAPKAVLMSMATYDALTGAGARSLDVLTEEFDALLAQMQTPKARRGMTRAFNATPSQLGQAAVAAARKRG